MDFPVLVDPVVQNVQKKKTDNFFLKGLHSEYFRRVNLK